MRKFTILAAVAPLALLAACGDNDADNVAMEDDTIAADTTANDMATDTGADGPATSLADAGDYSGVYRYNGDDGETALRINTSNNTYDYIGPDNEVRSGAYTTAPDGYRFRIADFYGSPAWFTISNGSLVKLQQDTEITADNSMTVTGDRYERAEEDDAVFSRFPEPGSPVAPQDL